MGFLIDTNVLSEMRKQARANANVIKWAKRNRASDLFLSVLTLGEVRMGALGLERRDPVGAARVGAWVDALLAHYAGRVLPVTADITETWARLSVPDRLPVVDGLLAATAIAHKLILVTRNTRDVARTGVQLLNPFDEPPPEV